MPRRQKEPSPVMSEEEDVDGDLSEMSSTSSSETESGPVNEVVYLPEDSSNFMPEEESQGEERQNPSGPIIKVKTIDSLRKTEAELENTVQSSSSSNASSEIENNIEVGNTGCANGTSVSKNKGCVKKARYVRQATPICDAIMREYSRRMRLMKEKGITDPSELGDNQIQDLLKKAKENLNSKKNGTEVTTEISADHVTSDEESEDNSDVPLIKQEIIETKPEEINLLSFNKVKKEQDESEDSSTITSSRQKPTRGRPRAVRKRKRQEEWDDDDDTDEDPDFDPIETGTATKSKRATRSTRFRNDTPENGNDTCSVPEIKSPDVENQNILSVPKEQAVNVAERLKSLAEKITDVLTEEPSPNITSEAEKLLQTTQELIKLQKEKMENKTNSCGSSVKIKEEILEDEPKSKTPSLENSGHSLQIYNQLQMHEAALQKKISAAVANKGDVMNISTAQTPTNLPNTENVASSTASIKDKCSFIMDFFTSYQDVFDEYILYCVIGELSNDLIIFINELSRCVKRIKEAESCKNMNKRRKEINLAKQSYLNTVMNSHEKFLPLFKHVVDNIIKTRTSRALMNTLILFIAGSLYIKCQDIIKDQIHRLRRVLLFVTKAYQYHHQLVSEVLTSPNDVFDNETMLVRHMLKYFQSRKFFKIPSELLCYYPEFSSEEEQQFQAELSILDTAILKDTDPLPKGVDHLQNQGGPSQPGGGNYRSSGLLNVTAEFVETLNNEPNKNTKSIEEKLDSLLNALSSSGNSLKPVKSCHISPQLSLDKGLTGTNKSSLTNFSVNLGRRVPNITTVKLSSYQDAARKDQDSSLSDDKETLLAQLLEKDHIGLDSLFSNYLKESSVKSEPVDVNSTFETIDVEEGLVAVKEEPKEIVSTEIKREEAIMSIDELVAPNCDDDITEEYHLTKKEEDGFSA